MIDITQVEVAEMQGFGIQVPLEFILKNAFKFNKKQIRDFKNMQLEDAAQRYNIATTEANGLVVSPLLIDNIIPFNKYSDYTGNSPEPA